DAPSASHGRVVKQYAEAIDPGALVMPAVDPAPEGKSVHEMSDRELLGVLVKGGVPEEVTLNALHEAQRRALPALVDASVVPLQNDSFIVRSETIKVLANAGDKRIVPQLMLSLDDHDPIVRREAARALGKLGDRRALGYLSSRLLKEDLDDIKIEIRASVEKINGFPMN
ncbi:MAG: HEAT repeat domain-containing protein, partial [Deltaproteobacteria bacterium]|nr:HEAT repeat domain-containing protein [Deltaproteobacteria bacterium]